MLDRIEIMGEWYVREKSIKPIEEKLLKIEDLTHSINCTWENGDWCFKATLLLMEGENNINNRYEGVSVEITDKRAGGRKDWIIDYIDNPLWIIGVLNGRGDMESVDKMFDENGLKWFKSFARCLVEKGWLNE